VPVPAALSTYLFLAPSSSVFLHPSSFIRVISVIRGSFASSVFRFFRVVVVKLLRRSSVAALK
jgi:hypothetical protein